MCEISIDQNPRKKNNDIGEISQVSIWFKFAFTRGKVMIFLFYMYETKSGFLLAHQYQYMHVLKIAQCKSAPAAGKSIYYACFCIRRTGERRGIKFYEKNKVYTGTVH